MTGCLRCSIDLVNQLCGLVSQALSGEDDRAKMRLKRTVSLAVRRGCPEAEQILSAGPSPKNVRPLCWNIASVLTETDLRTLGIEVEPR